MKCPALREFRRVVNMSRRDLLDWRRKRAKCQPAPRSSGRTAADELRLVAELLRREPRTAAECKKASDLVNFVRRHEAGRRRQKDPCSQERVIALRDWGVQPKGCPVPKGCKKSER
jgi:hypothetical protein